MGVIVNRVFLDPFFLKLPLNDSGRAHLSFSVESFFMLSSLFGGPEEAKVIPSASSILL
jgi:hypothetical protein